MAALSVVAAVIDKWSSLTFLEKPDELWFDGVPLKTTQGDAQTFPSVNLTDLGTTTSGGESFTFEYNIVGETTTVQFTIRAYTLLECDQIGLGIKYNGGAINAGQGYDFGTLTLEDGATMQMVRQSEQRFREPARGAASQVVHRLEIVYAIQVQEQP